MTCLDLLLQWGVDTETYDSANDNGDYYLAQAIYNYLDMLAEEIESFWRMN